MTKNEMVRIGRELGADVNVAMLVKDVVAAIVDKIELGET